MAGRALRTAIEEFDDVQKGFQVYTSQLERDQRSDDTESSAQLYDYGLSHIVEASLVQCEQWAEKTMKKWKFGTFSVPYAFFKSKWLCRAVCFRTSGD